VFTLRFDDTAQIINIAFLGSRACITPRVESADSGDEGSDDCEYGSGGGVHVLSNATCRDVWR